MVQDKSAGIMDMTIPQEEGDELAEVFLGLARVLGIVAAVLGFVALSVGVGLIIGSTL